MRIRGWLGVFALVAAVGAAVVVVPVSSAGADETRDGQWHLGYLNVERVHELSQGEGITVAVIDGGVDGDHPDLAGNVLEGIDAQAAVHGEDPGNGWNDGNGHGTAMAGLIAAHGHGSGGAEGALGLAPQVKIVPIRVPLSEKGSLDGDPQQYEMMTRAIDEAVARGADIISMSITGPYPDQIQPALDAGKIVVVSAGNRPGDHFVNATPGSVAVGAVRQDGTVADVSVRGQFPPPALEDLGSRFSAQFGFITLTAPGQDIVSTSLDGGYRMGTGTSPSTALVSAAAALVWSRYPDLTGDQVIRHLITTSTDKGEPGGDLEYGYGDLNVVRALETEPDTTPSTTVTSATILPPDAGPKATTPEVAAGTGDDTGSSGGIAGMVAIAAAVMGAACLLVGLAQQRQPGLSVAGAPGAPVGVGPPPPPPPRPPPAGPMPRPPAPTTRGRGLLVVGVVALSVAFAGGAYALTQDDDGGGRSPEDALPTGGPPEETPGSVDGLEIDARICFEGSMRGCDGLRDMTVGFVEAENITPQDAAPYMAYAQTCGGRTEQSEEPCYQRLADSNQ